MTLTYRAARSEILTFFKAAWDPTGHPALYPDVAADPPDTGPWARVALAHATGGQAAFSFDGTGRSRYRRNGIFTAQIFTPIGKGLSDTYDLAKIVADAYEGTATPNQVWFTNTRINEIGSSGNWQQLNVLTDFEYDEIK